MKTYEQLISEMSQSERKELENRLSVLIEHILKITVIRGPLLTNNLRLWTKSIRDQRLELVDLFEEHHHLKPEFTDQLLDKVYRGVVADLRRDYRHFSFPDSRQLSMEDIGGQDVIAALRK